MRMGQPQGMKRVEKEEAEEVAGGNSFVNMCWHIRANQYRQLLSVTSLAFSR